jgi:hypothetical protein
MRRLLGTALFCATAACVAAACDQLPDPAFASLEGSLTLRIVQITSAGAEEARFDLELRNGGAKRAVACLGPGRGIKRMVGPWSFIWVDHPSCVREFDLGPGGVFAWSETHDVAVRPGPPVEASIEVQILNPSRCSSVGCAGFMIESPPLTTSE